VVVNLFRTTTTAVLNHFAEGSQIQTYDFVREPHKKSDHKSMDTFWFIALTKSVTQNIRGVTERLCLIARNPFPVKNLKLSYTEHIFCLRIRHHQLLFK